MKITSVSVLADNTLVIIQGLDAPVVLLPEQTLTITESETTATLSIQDANTGRGQVILAQWIRPT